MEEEDTLFGEDFINGEEELICGEIEYDGEVFTMYKEKKTDKICWIDNIGVRGEHLFTFDGVKAYNLFADYPHNMSKKEKEIFDQENPYWADFFKDRN